MEAETHRKITTRDVARVDTEPDNEPVRESNAVRPEVITVGDDVKTPPASHDNGEQRNPLFSNDEEKNFRERWQNIQTAFVDEPRQAVEHADELIAEILQHLARRFSDQRSRLESEWEHSDKASTEELRLALRRYRSFCDRLLSIQ
jgi:hypothetical protein